MRSPAAARLALLALLLAQPPPAAGPEAVADSLAAPPLRQDAAAALQRHRAALARDPQDAAALAGLASVLDSAVECSSAPNASWSADTSTASPLELISHADAELSLWDGDWVSAVRQVCAANNASSRSLCLGHDLAASRSPGGRSYAAMVTLATRPPAKIGPGGERIWSALANTAASGAAHTPPAESVGHIGNGSRPLHFVYRSDGFLSALECAALLEAAAAHTDGWRLASHTPYPTADLHLDDLAAESLAMQRWIGEFVISRLYPLLAQLFSVKAGSLWLKEAVIIKYIPAVGESRPGRASGGALVVPAGVAEHRDASVLSFNILLTDPEQFDGGGTLFRDLLPADLNEGRESDAGGTQSITITCLYIHAGD